MRGTHCVWDSLIAGFVHWLEERGRKPKYFSSRWEVLAKICSRRWIWQAVWWGVFWWHWNWWEQYLQGENSSYAQALDPEPSIPIPLRPSFAFTKQWVWLPALIRPHSLKTTTLIWKSVLCSDPGGSFKTCDDVHLVCFLDPIFPSLSTL